MRADRTRRELGETMYMVFSWDVSRTAGHAGVRLHWGEETGWSCAHTGANPRIRTPRRPVAALRRVFAQPDDVATVAEQLV
ncbi:DUF6292 family protein [Streptomyces krungchingensis]